MNRVAIRTATVAKNDQNTILPRVTVKKWAIRIEAGTQAVSSNSSVTCSLRKYRLNAHTDIAIRNERN